MARSASLRHCLVILLVVLVAAVHGQPNAHAPTLEQDAAQNVRFICNFEHNACHFRNQFNLARFTRLMRPEGFLGERAVLLLDISKRSAKRYPGARLITHYYNAKYRNACLYLTYHMSGNAPEAFYVIQQDTENRCVYSDETRPRDSHSWKSVQLQLDLSEGSPRFFLQAEYNPNYNGYIAIANFSYAYGNCRHNQANYCFSGYQPDDEDQTNSNNNNNNNVIPPKELSKPMPDPF